MKFPYLLRHVLFQRCSVALMLLAHAIEAADTGHVASSAELDVVAAREIVLAVALHHGMYMCIPPIPS